MCDESNQVVVGWLREVRMGWLEFRPNTFPLFPPTVLS